jgi:AcrR family transcriptional regulator
MPAKRKSYHHGNLKAALVKSALELLAKRDAHALTLREVAKHAGVAHSATYRHFKDKNDLLVTVAIEGFERFSMLAANEIANNRNQPKALYESVAETYAKFAVENTQHFRLMFSGQIERRAEYGELTVAANRSFAQLLGTIELCQKAGYISKRRNAAIAALSLWGLLHGVASLLVESQLALPGNVSAEQLARTLSNILLRGLK